MKKILFALVFTLVLFPTKVFAQEYINNFDINIQILDSGKINVTERIDYYFDTPKHGIYREIPLVKTNDEGQKYLLTIENILVSENFYDESSTDKLNLKIGDPDITIVGPKTYTISYTVSGALTYFDAFDELYWNATGNEWQVPIKSASATISLNTMFNEFTNIYCYTGTEGSSESNCEVKKQGNSVVINAQNLSASGGLTTAVQFPKGLVQVLEPTLYEENFPWLLAIVISLMVLAFYIVLPVFLIIKYLKKGKKSNLEKQVVAAWFDPPKTADGRELTAGEAGLLQDKTPNIRDITAMFIQLAQKGYIKIVENEKKLLQKSNFSLKKLKDWKSSDLQEHEKLLLTELFGDGEEVFLNDLGKKTSTTTKINKVYKNISESLISSGILTEDIYKTRNLGIISMVFAAFFFNPLLFIAGLLRMRTVEKTEAGGDATAKLNSLKNFLKSQDKQLEFQADKQMMFEKLLPYAIAFGVEKVWLKRFENLQLAPPDWVDTNNAAVFNYGTMLNSFNTSTSSMYSSSSSHSSSGFSSGGGGFSGGGGGGGGGGSW